MLPIMKVYTIPSPQFPISLFLFTSHVSASLSMSHWKVKHRELCVNIRTCGFSVPHTTIGVLDLPYSPMCNAKRYSS